MSQKNIDRYVSFQGTNCDEKARRLISYIQDHIKTPSHPSPWLDYFQDKLSDCISLGQDELFVICSQMNNVRSLFEEYKNTEALSLLEYIEDVCC